MTATQEIARRVCQIPAEFHRRAVSVLQLVQESGCKDANSASPRRAVEEQLRACPELIEDWLTYSGDKRTSSGWFFEDDDATVVGYFESDKGTSHEQHFTDRSEACAEFIMRELEGMRERTT